MPRHKDVPRGGNKGRMISALRVPNISSGLFLFLIISAYHFALFIDEG